MLSLIVILMFSFLIDVPSVYACRGPKKINIIFRYDDFSSRSPLEFEKKLYRLFREYNVPCTWGVIPFVSEGDSHEEGDQKTIPLSASKIEWLRQGLGAGILEVALHGYSHQTIAKTADGRYTEFANLSYPGQLEKIFAGKKYLEQDLDVLIVTFIPPWGTYDFNTLRALKSLDFKNLSTLMWQGDGAFPALHFVPSTCALPDLCHALQAAGHLPDNNPVILVVFHPFDFVDVDSVRGNFSLEELRKTFEWLTQREDVRIHTISQATERLDGLDGNLFQSYQDMRRLFIYLPLPFKITYLKYTAGIYLSPLGVRNMAGILIGLSLGIYGLMFWGSFLALRSVFKRFLANRPGRIRFCHLSFPIVFLILLIGIFYDQRFNQTGISIAVIGLGAYLGFLKSFR